MRYPGNAQTRPQVVRLRAAPNPARFETSRPTVRDGRLRAQGTITDRAQGVVRLNITWTTDGQERTYARNARIDEGTWALDVALPDQTARSLAARQDKAHSTIAFTGYLPQRIRGETHTFQVAAD